MFEMNNQELNEWRSHFAMSNVDRQGLRHPPFCFTEHGILQLSNVLKSERGIKVSFLIIDVFVKLRQTLTDQTEVWLAIEKIKGRLDNQDKNAEILFRYLDELSNLIPPMHDFDPRKRIGYMPEE